MKILQKIKERYLKHFPQKEHMNNKVTCIICFVLCIGILVVAFLPPQQKRSEEAPAKIPEENGTYALHFCPRENCTKILLNTLETANSSAKCAFYDFDLKESIEFFKENKKKIEIAVIVDKQNYQPEQFEQKANNPALMHNKFCIIDQHTVITGSMNPTVNDATKNNNNLFIINSTYLAKNYLAEFDEMQQGTFGKGTTETKTPYPIILFNNNTFENYFCPEDHCEKEVIKELEKANTSIYFMTFSFTSTKVAEMLVNKSKQGIHVQGIVEKRRWSMKDEKGKPLLEQGIEIKQDENKHILHHKVFIIDNTTVIFGSYNPSKAANERNDENVMIAHDKKITRRFLEEFERLQWIQQK